MCGRTFLMRPSQNRHKLSETFAILFYLYSKETILQDFFYFSSDFELVFLRAVQVLSTNLIKCLAFIFFYLILFNYSPPRPMVLILYLYSTLFVQ